MLFLYYNNVGRSLKCVLYPHIHIDTLFKLNLPIIIILSSFIICSVFRVKLKEYVDMCRVGNKYYRCVRFGNDIKPLFPWNIIS